MILCICLQISYEIFQKNKNERSRFHETWLCIALSLYKKKIATYLHFILTDILSYKRK